jgi:hypothetical protein
MELKTDISRTFSVPPLAGSARDYVVEDYTANDKDLWDQFAAEGKNSTFLFQRDYMDYHSHRFVDHSLMVYRQGKLVAMLPANFCEPDTLVSHGGLTYGGFILRRSASLEEVLEILYYTFQHLHQKGISRMLYKQIPHFYNTLPDEDVAYGLFLVGAHVYRRDCALVVNQADRLRFSKCRKRWIHKAQRSGVALVQDNSFLPFWEQVLIPRLATRYQVRPTHSLEEITLLALRFPQNIKQFAAYHEGEIVAGTTIYETPTVAHAQYIAVSDKGAAVGALDYLFGWLIEERYRDKLFFDFGICNERDSHLLNLGLLHWKQGFAGRTCAHDFYEVRTSNYPQLVEVLQGRL